MSDYAAARLNMVDGQLRTNKVTDEAVLEAFLATPRELFVPDHLKGAAYVDEDLPIGGGRFLIEPMILGRLLQVAAIQPDESVLEIGSGSGYGTAVLARIASKVVGIEQDRALARRATALLAQLGLGNAVVREGRLDEGWPTDAPYDVIVFNGATAEVPPAVFDQLAEGGRIMAVLKPDAGLGRAMLFVRRNGVISRRVLFDAATPLLPALAPQPSFVF